MASRIDVNADLGENCGDDQALLPLITSANIAAGAHAGGGTTLTETVHAAARHGVNVGAHISYPDRDNFGRTSMLNMLTPSELADTVTQQLRAVHQAALAAGTHITHVKPHGALYNDVNRDPVLARHLVRILTATARSLTQPVWPLFGLPNSVLADIASEYGVTYVPEGFADRSYQTNGQLTPRTEPNAVHHDTATVVTQAVAMATLGTVTVNTPSGPVEVRVPVETLCVHGDTPDAVEHVRAIRAALTASAVTIVGFNR